MKKIALLLLGIIGIIFSGCSCKKDQVHLPYEECLDALVMEHVSLDELSAHLRVDVNKLAGMRLGMFAKNDELTGAINDLYRAFAKDEESARELLLEPSAREFLFASDSDARKMDVKDVEIAQNALFQGKIDDLTIRYLSEKADGFMDKNFSMMAIPRMVWSGVTESKEEIVQKWEGDLNATLDINGLSDFLNLRIRNYVGYLNVQRKINKKPLLSEDASFISLENKGLKFDQTTGSAIKERINNEVYSSLVLFLIELLIGFIVTFIINRCINARIANVMGLHENLGFFIGLFSQKSPKTMGVLGFINNMIESYRVDRIKEKYEARKRWVNFVSAALFFAGTWYFFDSKSVELEGLISNEIYVNISDYLSTQNTYFVNKINKYTELL